VLALYFANLGWEKLVFRANIATYNCLCVLIVLAMIAPTGLITQELGVISLALLPAVAFGLVLGTWILPRVPQKQFALLTTGLIALSGIVLLAMAAVDIPMAMPGMDMGGRM
jgi:uncharacterized membrane protein YfcA